MTLRRLLNRSPCAFTLIELLVVITLMALAVGMTVVRLDGLSESGRLSAAARQVQGILHVAQAQARATGEPRLIEFQAGSDQIRLRAPAKESGRWRWNEGRSFQTATGIHFERLLFEGDTQGESRAASIRVDGDGRYPAYAIILELHGRHMVITNDTVEGCTHRLVEVEPQARNLAELRRELAGNH